jgi:hypothetical protein
VQAGLSRARALRSWGLSIRKIAAETGVSTMTVQRILAASAPVR